MKMYFSFHRTEGMPNLVGTYSDNLRYYESSQLCLREEEEGIKLFAPLSQ